MPKTHNKGGYTVIVNDNGSILVKPGDSISKYSMAIHGDYNHLQEYQRHEGGMLKPIANINMIMAGETLFHQPSLPIGGVAISPVPSPNVGEDNDLERIIRESGLSPQYYDPFSIVLKGGGYVGRFVSFVGTYASAEGMFATLFTSNAVLSPIVFLLGSVYGLYSARNYSISQAGMRGTTYGAVAWAFDDPRPSLPRAIRQSLLESGRSDDLDNYVSTWSIAVAEAQNKLNNFCQNEGLDPIFVKMVFKAESLIHGGGFTPRSEWLAAGMLLDVADKYYSSTYHKLSLLQPWSLYPNDQYRGGRPSYPAEIAKRYPY